MAAGGRFAIGPSFNDAPDEAEAKARGPFPGFLPEHVTLVNRSETPHAEGFAQEMAQGAGLPVGQIHRLPAWLPAGPLQTSKDAFERLKLFFQMEVFALQFRILLTVVAETFGPLPTPDGNPEQAEPLLFPGRCLACQCLRHVDIDLWGKPEDSLQHLTMRYMNT